MKKLISRLFALTLFEVIIMASVSIFSSVHAATPILVNDMNPGYGDMFPQCSSKNGCPVVNGYRLYLVKRTPGVELWKTDGTTTGTSLVKVIDSSTTDTYALTAFQGKAIFSVTSTTNEAGVWVSDGTAEGTVQLSQYPIDINSPITVANTKAYILTSLPVTLAATNATRYELLVTEGTPATTVAIETLTSDTDKIEWVQKLGTTNSALYLVISGADQNNLTFTLKKTTGVPIETDIVSTWTGVTNYRFDGCSAGSLVLFDQVQNQAEEIWYTDGTTQGTAKLMNGSVITGECGAYLAGYEYFPIYSAATGKYSFIRVNLSTKAVETVLADTTTTGIVTVGSYVYFLKYVFFYSNYSKYDHSELWRTDGTTTTLVRNPVTKNMVRASDVFTRINGNKLYYYLLESTGVSGEWSTTIFDYDTSISFFEPMLSVQGGAATRIVMLDTVPNADLLISYGYNTPTGVELYRIQPTPVGLVRMYYTFGKWKYMGRLTNASLRVGDTLYMKNYDSSKYKVVQFFLYDYTKKGNQSVSITWLTPTAARVKTVYNLTTNRQYAFVMKVQDKATGVVVAKYFVFHL